MSPQQKERWLASEHLGPGLSSAPDWPCSPEEETASAPQFPHQQVRKVLRYQYGAGGCCYRPRQCPFFLPNSWQQPMEPPCIRAGRNVRQFGFPKGETEAQLGYVNAATTPMRSIFLSLLLFHVSISLLHRVMTVQGQCHI